MTLATILIIALMPEADPSYVYRIALPSHDACEEAMADAFAALQQHYPQMEGYCHRSAILWASPVPKERP